MAAPRPGCVPLRPLGVSDILDGSFTAVRRNPRVMLGLSAGFAVLQVLITTLVQVVAFRGLANVRTNGSSAPLVGGEGLELVTLFVSTLLGAVLTGMLTVSVTQDVLGRRVDLAGVWAQVRPRVWTLVGLSLITSLLEFLGLFACLAPGIWLWGIWAVAVPVCMVEQTTIRGALGRSRHLVRGTFWRVWGIRALGQLVIGVVAALLVVPFELVGVLAGGTGLNALGGGADLPVAYLVIIGIGEVLAATLTAPIKAGIDALLYVDLRMRKEGLDIALQQAAAPQRPVPGQRPTGQAPPMTAC